MTFDEALSYINNFTWSSSRLGLERTKELLNRLGNPQKQLKFIHVAGTNGKGSTCAMLASILKEAGYRVGLYPSPYLEDFRERIEVDGEMISKDELVEITEQVSREADAMEDHPSQFELITAIGMLYYVKCRCDIVVLEVGMGGELDSTNVIDAPEIAVITSIGLDHTEYLGDTIEKIAATKAGIIKKGCDAVTYDNAPSVINVIKEKCQREGVRLYLSAGLTEEISHGLDGQSFYYHSDMTGTERHELSLLGRHQLKNAAVAVKTVEVLRKRGWRISDAAVHNGLKNVKWKARFEVLSSEPLFILDGGHNPQCAEALAENIEEYINNDTEEKRPAGRKKSCVTFLIGMLADKDYKKTLEILRPYGASYVCITPDSPRALSGRRLAEAISDELSHDAVSKDAANKERNAVSITAADDIPHAIETALSYGLPVVAFGSLYSAGKIRSTYLNKYLT